MRAAAAVAVVLLGIGSAAHGGELDQLRKENAELRARVQELESENARLRGGSGGLAAALEQRATAAVAVAPGEAPGSTTITTEASRSRVSAAGSRGTGSRGAPSAPPGQAGRPDSAAIVIDTVVLRSHLSRRLDAPPGGRRQPLSTARSPTTGRRW